MRGGDVLQFDGICGIYFASLIAFYFARDNVTIAKETNLDVLDVLVCVGVTEQD